MTFRKSKQAKRMVLAVAKSDDVRVQEILTMLSYRRPAGSSSEEAFIERFIRSEDPVDMAGNLVVTIARPDGSFPETLFSCHTDTVHRKHGRQLPSYDKELNLVWKQDGEPLGADDAAGVYVLLQMIRAKVPGAYVFHAAEERGGIGSRQMAKEYPEWLRQFKRAVAFDRKGTGDVITHQGGDRCCSDAFGDALSTALYDQGLQDYLPSDGGMFTDTANYTELIPECTNLSAGYEDEHTKNESLDLNHLLALADAAIKVDWDALPTERDPSEVPEYRGIFGNLIRYESDTEFSVEVLELRDALEAAGLDDLNFSITDTEINVFARTNPEDYDTLLETLERAGNFRVIARNVVETSVMESVPEE